jgi:hypothetical protein
MTKKRGLAFLILLVIISDCNGQFNGGVTEVLAKLDSIRNSSSVSKYFAGIYFETTTNAAHFFSGADTNVQRLVVRLEKRFAYYFFYPAYAYENNADIPGEWKAYYSDVTASTLRHMLLGINAHINGDIWQALTAEFSLEEIRQLKPSYFLYQKSLLENYKSFYQSAIESNAKIKAFHLLSFGFDKIYGKIMLRHWRKRQMELAELFFINKELFEKKLIKVRRKMDRLNERIRRNT